MRPGALSSKAFAGPTLQDSQLLNSPAFAKSGLAELLIDLMANKINCTLYTLLHQLREAGGERIISAVRFGSKTKLRLFAAALPLLLAAAVPGSLDAANTTVTFEGLPDSTVLATQYPGLTFSNTIILSAGITLNEFEFPPHSGSNVASDNAGPITITFASPVESVSGYFTYSVPLTIQAFDASNNLLASAVSRFSSNEALSGVAGRVAGEPLAVNASANIAKIVITGAASGTSFTMDDMTISPFSQCDPTQAGTANVAGVQRIINEALGGVTATDDLNQDGVLDAVDIQIEINAALSLGCAAR